MIIYVLSRDVLIIPLTSLGPVYVYAITEDSFSLLQTINAVSGSRQFGRTLVYSPSDTHLAVGDDVTNNLTGMYEMYDACM